MKRRDSVKNIGSSSLAHLVLHRGKSNGIKSKKGWTAGWFGSSSKRGGVGGGDSVPFSVRSMSGGDIRNGADAAERLEDAVCADGKELFGPHHDLTTLSHGISRVLNDNEDVAMRNGKRSKHKRKRQYSLRCEDVKEVCALCSVWWTTRARRDFVIFGTNDGRLCLIDVRSHHKTWVEVGGESLRIESLELIIDIKSSSVLIHCSDHLYYILLLERPHRSASSQHHPLSGGSFGGTVSQELLMAEYMMKHPHRQLDASQIMEWDLITDHLHQTAFHPIQLNLGTEEDADTPNASTLSLGKRTGSHSENESGPDVAVSLSVYHNTGSVIADPHQQTPTPSEKAARMLGIPYPRRRIVANKGSPNAAGHRSASGQSTNDPLRTEHAQSCVHFGVFYAKQVWFETV